MTVGAVPGWGKPLKLRERFSHKGAFDTGVDPLVRLGALYHLGRDSQDTAHATATLLDILSTHGPEPGSAAYDREAVLFALHTATRLAHYDQFAGIEYILQYLLTSPAKEARDLAGIALASCHRFPLAVLMARAFELAGSGARVELLGPVMRMSESDMIALGKLQEQDQNARLDALGKSIKALNDLPRSEDFELGLGVLINRPVLVDIGFRHTGYVSVEAPDGSLKLVSYAPSCVVNQNNPLLRQNVWELQRSPGRRVIAVYRRDGAQEAEFIYLLPFAFMRNMESYLKQLVPQSGSTQLAVVFSKWTHKDKERYRLITASGQTVVGSYRAAAQRIGDCFIYDPSNPRPLTTRCAIPRDGLPPVIDEFVRHTDLALAVHVNYNKRDKRHLILSDQGDAFEKRGEEYDPKALYVIEDVPWGRAPFQISQGEWPLEQRLDVMERFFNAMPRAHGVVLDMMEGRDRKRLARVVQTDTGQTFLQPVDSEIPAGTLACCREWEDQKGYHIAATILERFRIEDACPNCFGFQNRICPECEGSTSVTCPACHGPGKVRCERCEGTGICHVCDGDGRYRDSGRACLSCKGSNDCQFCGSNPGWRYCRDCKGKGRVPCSYCEGSRITSCECEGNWQGTLVESF